MFFLRVALIGRYLVVPDRQTKYFVPHLAKCQMIDLCCAFLTWQNSLMNRGSLNERLPLVHILIRHYQGCYKRNGLSFIFPFFMCHTCRYNAEYMKLISSLNCKAYNRKHIFTVQSKYKVTLRPKLWCHNFIVKCDNKYSSETFLKSRLSEALTQSYDRIWSSLGDIHNYNEEWHFTVEHISVGVA